MRHHAAHSRGRPALPRHNRHSNFVSYLIDGDRHGFLPTSVVYTAGAEGPGTSGEASASLADWLAALPVAPGGMVSSECYGQRGGGLGAMGEGPRVLSAHLGERGAEQDCRCSCTCFRPSIVHIAVLSLLAWPSSSAASVTFVATPLGSQPLETSLVSAESLASSVLAKPPHRVARPPHLLEIEMSAQRADGSRSERKHVGYQSRSARWWDLWHSAPGTVYP